MKKVFPQDQTNQTLDRFRQGDSEAFASLYQSHWQQVFRFSRLYLRSDDDAEDVVQEVFIRLWQIHERIHPDDNFSGLLFIITRNLIFNRFRRQIDPLGFKVSVLAALEASDDIESEISARDLSEYIDRLVDLMPARQRQVFNMSRREHKSYREIAEELDLSQKTVEAHMHEALRFLRDNLAVLLWLALFHDGMTS
ncbi:RNA polymerase sigma-70 factor [Alistipes sp. kh20]|uniref:RNA polymerase sigma-70 factor n=1 Tax=Alistipes montrealensis TaxID=2834113 RepID=UPI001BD11294|nr:RNA polymerase sigma-70 factor [Alistipes montrealensis]MBS4767079.1 RNA polymerase sigma-70 factor [Alistipes montrealensis]